jgi:hypothetical protein
MFDSALCLMSSNPITADLDRVFSALVPTSAPLPRFCRAGVFVSWEIAGKGPGGGALSGLYRLGNIPFNWRSPSSYGLVLSDRSICLSVCLPFLIIGMSLSLNSNISLMYTYMLC